MEFHHEVAQTSMATVSRGSLIFPFKRIGPKKSDLGILKILWINVEIFNLKLKIFTIYFVVSTQMLIHRKLQLTLILHIQNFPQLYKLMFSVFLLEGHLSFLS